MTVLSIVTPGVKRVMVTPEHAIEREHVIVIATVLNSPGFKDA